MKLTSSALAFIATSASALGNDPIEGKLRNRELSPSSWSITSDSNTTVVDFSGTSGENATINTVYDSSAAADAQANLQTYLLDGSCVPTTASTQDRIASEGTCSVQGAAGISTDCTYKLDKTELATSYTGYNAGGGDVKPTLTMCEVAQLSLLFSIDYFGIGQCKDASSFSYDLVGFPQEGEDWTWESCFAKCIGIQEYDFSTHGAGFDYTTDDSPGFEGRCHCRFSDGHIGTGAVPGSNGVLGERTGTGPVENSVYPDDRDYSWICYTLNRPLNPMTLVQKFTNLVITFENSQEFDVVTVNLSPAEIDSNSQTTSLSDYISASNCNTDEELEGGELPPNTQLCIKIESSSPDVRIEKITDMAMTGAGGSLAVVKADGTAEYEAITTIGTYNLQEVTVRTRVPTNRFNFEAANAAIEVTGSVIVKFAGRRLRVDIDRLLQAANEEETASFDININLASEPNLALEGGEEVMMNSAIADAGKAFAILGMVFVSAFALW